MRAKIRNVGIDICLQDSLITTCSCKKVISKNTQISDKTTAQLLKFSRHLYTYMETDRHALTRQGENHHFLRLRRPTNRILISDTDFSLCIYTSFHFIFIGTTRYVTKKSKNHVARNFEHTSENV